jgi:hypothetical protein
LRHNAANDLIAGAWPKADRVQIRIGAFRFTATPSEAITLAGEMADAAETAMAHHHD